MFGVGRNNPRVRAALVDVLERGDRLRRAARNLAALGRAGGGAARPASGAARAGALHELGHGGRRGGAQDGPRGDRPPARGRRGPRVPRADVRLAVGWRGRRVPRAVRAAHARLRPRAVQRPRRAGGRAAARGRRRLPGRAGAGQGREPSRAGLPGGRAGAVPAVRDAVLRRRGADRARPHGTHVRSRALGARARPRPDREDAVRWLRPGRRVCDVGRRDGRRVRLDGARSAARVDVCAERPRLHGGARHPGASSTLRVWSNVRPGSARSCWSARSLWRSARSCARCAASA